jgi:hypothetical protein
VHSFYYMDPTRDFHHCKRGDIFWVIVHRYDGAGGEIAGEYRWVREGAYIRTSPIGWCGKAYRHKDVTGLLSGFRLKTQDGWKWAVSDPVRYYAAGETHLYKFVVADRGGAGIMPVAEVVRETEQAVADRAAEVKAVDLLHHVISAAPTADFTQRVNVVARSAGLARPRVVALLRREMGSIVSTQEEVYNLGIDYMSAVSNYGWRRWLRKARVRLLCCLVVAALGLSVKPVRAAPGRAAAALSSAVLLAPSVARALVGRLSRNSFGSFGPVLQSGSH